MVCNRYRSCTMGKNVWNYIKNGKAIKASRTGNWMKYDAYPIETFRLKYMTIHSVQLPPSTCAASVDASFGKWKNINITKEEREICLECLPRCLRSFRNVIFKIIERESVDIVHRIIINIGMLLLLVPYIITIRNVCLFEIFNDWSGYSFVTYFFFKV